MLTIVLGGCLEVETTTRVNADGRLQRTVEISGDSSALARGEYPLALHGPWSIRLEKGSDKKVHLKATREFGDVDSLNAAIQGEPGRSLSFHASLNRQFLWFTTTFRYEETIERFYPFQTVPVTDYVSPHEIDLYLHHEMEEEPYPTPGDSLALEGASDRFNAWEQRSRFEAFFQELATGAQLAGDPRLTPERLAGQKEKLFQLALREKVPGNVEDLLQKADTVFGKEPVRTAFEANREGFQEYERKLQFVEMVGTTGFKMHVEMPGLITDTNAPAMEGNTVTWSEFKGYCYVRNYTMWVESRLINWWAIVLTGAIVLAVMALFAAAALRRRPSLAGARGS